jgi:hypothetical protein
LRSSLWGMFAYWKPWILMCVVWCISDSVAHTRQWAVIENWIVLLLFFWDCVAPLKKFCFEWWRMTVNVTWAWGIQESSCTHCTLCVMTWLLSKRGSQHPVASHALHANFEASL